ncbi:UDP-glycosyltransferase 74D1 [Spatholobus suberectus]|nr:UDP-glycosyltransferase 74D1 [Spatholobus suberectus]
MRDSTSGIVDYAYHTIIFFHNGLHVKMAKTDVPLSLDLQVTEWLKIWSKLKTIGPTIPSMFLDKQVKDDDEYGFSLFKSEECVKWMDNKPKGSIVYVSLGSLSTLHEQQMEEVAFGLQESGCHFSWAVRATEVHKIPKGIERFKERFGGNMVLSIESIGT